MTENQNRITDLLKTKYGISHITRSLNITSKDDLFTAYRKLAKYLYSNAYDNHELNEDMEKQAIINKIPKNYEIYNVEKIASYIFSDNERDAFYKNYKFGDWTNNPKKYGTDINTAFEHAYKVHMGLNVAHDREKRKILPEDMIAICDPHNTTLKNHGIGGKWRTNYGKKDWVSAQTVNGWTIYNDDQLIGFDKITKDIINSSKFQNLDDDLKKNVQTYLDAMQSRYVAGKSVRDRGLIFQIDPTADLLKLYGKEIPGTDRLLFEDREKGVSVARTKKLVEEQYKDNQALRYLDNYLSETYNLTLQQEALQDQEKTLHHAKYFQEKKYINKSTRSEMTRLSSKLENFKDVEIDNEVDLEKLKKLEPELKKTTDILPTPKSGKLPILRFRKLKNHHAVGLFTPVNNTIAVDFRDDGNGGGLGSFTHEYGHYLDWNNAKEGNPTMSLSPEFEPILRSVQTEIRKNSDISNKRKNYLSIPSEVYARSFALWAYNQGLSNSLNDTPESFNDPKNDEYNSFTDETISKIDGYFNEAFPDLSERIRSLNSEVAQQNQNLEENQEKTVAKEIVNYNIGLSNAQEAYNRLDNIKRYLGTDDNPFYNPNKAISVTWVDSADSHVRNIGLYPMNNDHDQDKNLKNKVNLTLNVPDQKIKSPFENLDLSLLKQLNLMLLKT